MLQPDKIEDPVQKETVAGIQNAEHLVAIALEEIQKLDRKLETILHFQKEFALRSEQHHGTTHFWIGLFLLIQLAVVAWLYWGA